MDSNVLIIRMLILISLGSHLSININALFLSYIYKLCLKNSVFDSYAACVANHSPAGFTTYVNGMCYNNQIISCDGK